MALENSGEIFDKVTKVFFALNESNSSPEMVEISEKFYPAVTKFSDELTMNDKLFDRIKHIYDNRDSIGLAPDQKRAVEDYYKRFTLNGALLPADKKAELMEVNGKLSELYLKFNKNLLNATNSFEIVVCLSFSLPTTVTSVRRCTRAIRPSHRLASMTTVR